MENIKGFQNLKDIIFLNSKFLIRVNKKVFNKKISQMKSNDGKKIEINIKKRAF